MFAVLHFLNEPGDPASLAVDGVGYGYARHLRNATEEFTRRVDTGRARFIAVGAVDTDTGIPHGRPHVVSAVPRPDSRMELYPLEIRAMAGQHWYGPVVGHGAVYTLTLDTAGQITVTDHQPDYVCNGNDCHQPIRYTAHGWIHTATRSLIAETCQYVAINSNVYPATPITRETIAIAERSRAARRATLAANPLNW